MKKFKAVWKYVVVLILYPPLWLAGMVMSFLLSVLYLAVLFEWRMSDAMIVFGVELNFFRGFKTAEESLRRQVLEAYEE